MIQPETILKIADNSGAKTVKCIKILNGFKKRTAKLGDFITVSIKKLKNKSKKTSKVKKGEIYKALIIRAKVTNIKNTGLNLRFKSNAVVLINKQENPIGTRIIGPISKILQKKVLQKFTNLGSGLI